MNKNIYVTQPLLPNLENLEKELSEIWESKIVTNAGVKHNLLEEKLKEHFDDYSDNGSDETFCIRSEIDATLNQIQRGLRAKLPIIDNRRI